jgi:hypothetical protein
MSIREAELQRERMQRTATRKSLRVGYAGWYGSLALVLASLAGCGGASAGATPDTAQSAVVKNSPAVIGGTPGAQAQSGQAYSFTPSASDPDGDELTFSIQNKPSWASFTTSTGQLSGTPGNTQAGTYSNIVISVSDGTTNTPLAPFSITVTAATPPAASGSALVSWNAPVANTDGSPLLDLGGYRIDYGTSAGTLTSSVIISDPAATSYTLQGLTAGTWYFAVLDFTSGGTVSALSAVVSKTIP